jgi:excisionase family DNA binding protein
MALAYAPTATFHLPEPQRELLRVALDTGVELVIRQADGGQLASDELTRLLRVALAELAAGGDVIVLRGEAEVSPAEAGELLGLSRQFVDRLIDRGDLPARRLPGSRHRRVRVADVTAFRQRGDERKAMIADAVNDVVDAGADY